MDQPSTKLRLAAVIATVVALLAISVPFVWQHDLEAEPVSVGMMSPVASHANDAAPASLDGEQETASAACMADAKPAKLDFTMKDLDGKEVSLTSYKGKVILLNFWATWCGPCKVEIPDLIELQREYPDELVVVGLDLLDEWSRVKPFADTLAVNYPLLDANNRKDVEDAFGPMWGLPTTVIVGRDGKVAKRHSGIATKEQFKQYVESLL